MSRRSLWPSARRPWGHRRRVRSLDHLVAACIQRCLELVYQSLNGPCRYRHYKLSPRSPCCRHPRLGKLLHEGVAAVRQIVDRHHAGVRAPISLLASRSLRRSGSLCPAVALARFRSLTISPSAIDVVHCAGEGRVSIIALESHRSGIATFCQDAQKLSSRFAGRYRLAPLSSIRAELSCSS